MEDNKQLNGPFIFEKNESEVENIVILLHGYGSNGNDLINIAYNLKDTFPNTYFSAPNAPYLFEAFQGGFKWFNIYIEGTRTDEPEVQKQKVVKEFNNSSKMIEQYIYHLSKKYSLGLNKIFLLGFSQGSMMSLEIGTKLKSSIGGIISLSGRIYSENFNNVDRIKCPVLIVHGEEDDVIKPHRFYETCDILIKSGYIIEKHLIKKMGHTINEEVIEIVSNFLKSYQ